MSSRRASTRLCSILPHSYSSPSSNLCRQRLAFAPHAFMRLLCLPHVSKFLTQALQWPLQVPRSKCVETAHQFFTIGQCHIIKTKRLTTKLASKTVEDTTSQEQCFLVSSECHTNWHHFVHCLWVCAVRE